MLEKLDRATLEKIVKRSTLTLLSIIFLALLFGLVFTATENPLPSARQLTNPEASALELTSEQGVQLALLSAFVVINIVGIGATLAAVFWYLNRQIATIDQEPDSPTDLNSLQAQGAAMRAAISENVLQLMIGIGVLLTILTVLAVLLL